MKKILTFIIALVFSAATLAMSGCAIGRATADAGRGVIDGAEGIGNAAARTVTN